MKRYQYTTDYEHSWDNCVVEVDAAASAEAFGENLWWFVGCLCSYQFLSSTFILMCTYIFRVQWCAVATSPVLHSAFKSSSLCVKLLVIYRLYTIHLLLLLLPGDDGPDPGYAVNHLLYQAYVQLVTDKLHRRLKTLCRWNTTLLAFTCLL
jgi:hypothetical protein